MEQLSQLEGFTAADWQFTSEVPDYDGGIEYWEFLHQIYRSDHGGIELELTPEGGWCVFVRWGTNGDEVAFLTVDEAIEFWNNLRSLRE